MGKQLWSWQWVNGGFNSCFAHTKDEAILKAKVMGMPVAKGMQVTLVPDEKTFSSDYVVYDRLCKQYAMD